MGTKFTGGTEYAGFFKNLVEKINKSKDMNDLENVKLIDEISQSLPKIFLKAARKDEKNHSNDRIYRKNKRNCIERAGFTHRNLARATLGEEELLVDRLFASGN